MYVFLIMHKLSTKGGIQVFRLQLLFNALGISVVLVWLSLKKYFNFKSSQTATWKGYPRKKFCPWFAQNMSLSLVTFTTITRKINSYGIWVLLPRVSITFSSTSANTVYYLLMDYRKGFDIFQLLYQRLFGNQKTLLVCVVVVRMSLRKKIQ